METLDLTLLVGAVTGLVQLWKLLRAGAWKSVGTIVVAVAGGLLGGLSVEEIEIYEGVMGGFSAVGLNTTVRDAGKNK